MLLGNLEEDGANVGLDAESEDGILIETHQIFDGHDLALGELLHQIFNLSFGQFGF